MENIFDRPDFVHAKILEKYDELALVTFPDGFSCYTHTNMEETELIYNEIFIKQEYQNQNFGLDIDKANCIIDVGANIGIFTLYSKLRNPLATIYSIEPIPDTFEILKLNIDFHNFNKINLFNFAIGLDNSSIKQFVYYPNMPGNATSNPDLKHIQYEYMVETLGKERTEWLFTKSERKCQVHTLSKLIDENKISQIDFLKIDVEGDEILVLESIRSEQYKLISQIVLEVHTTNLIDQTQIKLNQMGFKTFVDRGLTAENVTVYAKQLK
jgi:FkbM family methyltransferase